MPTSTRLHTFRRKNGMQYRRILGLFFLERIMESFNKKVRICEKCLKLFMRYAIPYKILYCILYKSIRKFIICNYKFIFFIKITSYENFGVPFRKKITYFLLQSFSYLLKKYLKKYL